MHKRIVGTNVSIANVFASITADVKTGFISEKITTAI
jgi:hypothetical protein